MQQKQEKKEIEKNGQGIIQKKKKKKETPIVKIMKRNIQKNKQNKQKTQREYLYQNI